MTRQEVWGICRICGKEGKLTFEHVPPKATFNNNAVKIVGAEEILKAVEQERKPWEIADLRGQLKRKGIGGYYLCEDCNRKTGAWYGEHYKKFVHAICYVANELVKQDMKSVDNLKIEKIRPLAIYKQIIAMFCDINENCFGDEKVKEFILNKESLDFDTDKYKVYMYIPGGNMQKLVGESVVIPRNDASGMFRVSEIAAYPVGFLLCIDKPDWFEIQQTDLSAFAKHDYWETVNVEMWLNKHEVNTIFPMDYREENLI